jgi:hypothetical protein
MMTWSKPRNMLPYANYQDLMNKSQSEKFR